MFMRLVGERYFFRIWLLIASLCLFCSCSDELVHMMDVVDSDGEGRIIVTCKPFEFVDETRTVLSVSKSNDEITFEWKENDTIGVFPVSPISNTQAKQVIRSLNDSLNLHGAEFAGGGWMLDSANSYVAYYPYNGSLWADTEYDCVPVVMPSQTQKGNNTLDHIDRNNDYMYAVATLQENGSLSFDFNHAVSILKLELDMPVGDSWKSVTLVNTDNDSVFITEGTLNSATGVVTSTCMTPTVTIDLDSVISTLPNSLVTLYMTVFPTMSKETTIIAERANGMKYVATVDSCAFVAGKAHRLMAKMYAVPTGNGTENGYEYIDLGLPSGLKWATMNVGANMPEECGRFYAWGETKSFLEEDTTNIVNYNNYMNTTYVKSYYYWNTYKWYSGLQNVMTKYCIDPNFGSPDNKIVLEPEDDAAVQNWGGKWRMPTQYEFLELHDKCSWVWTDSYNETGVKGYVVTGPNNNSIFLPVTGYRSNYQYYSADTYGCYWTSSLGQRDGGCAWCFDFNSEKCDYGSSHSRCNGRNVRAVCE